MAKLFDKWEKPVNNSCLFHYDQYSCEQIRPTFLMSEDVLRSNLQDCEQLSNYECKEETMNLINRNKFKSQSIVVSWSWWEQ